MDDFGKLLLRITVGGLLLFHGISKIVHGVGAIPDLLAAKGLPAFLAYGAYAGEVVAPLFLIAGVFTLPAAVLVAVNMLFAIFLAHTRDFFTLGQHGEWKVEPAMYFLLGAIAIACIGPGKIVAWKMGGKRSA
jgi:putative oxidoreductase